MPLFLPRIEIDLSKIQDNARMVSELYGRQGISIMGVSKAVLGEPAIASAMVQGGVKFIADSRLENIQKMKAAGIVSQFVLLRTSLSQADSVVKTVDISLNSEIETLRKLSHCAERHNKRHRVIIMVELGDLREGVLPCDLSQFVAETLALSHVKIAGIGCNLACYGGIKPDDSNMRELSKRAQSIEKEFEIDLGIVSGGNSANYGWYSSTRDVGRINNLRIGESILLGREPVGRRAIPGLHTKAFQIFAEVIESKEKPSLPSGTVGQDAFGNIPDFQDRGIHQRAILALGKQDTLVSGLTSDSSVKVLGSSSDHMIVDSDRRDFRIGDAVNFDLDYGSLLSAMTSPFIQKTFVGCDSG
ncbi:MAG: alanine/ornithine racemase family PLP-dependent enzyme [Elainellaceae cyanobacterium]